MLCPYRFSASAEGDVLVSGVFDIHSDGKGRDECSMALNPTAVQNVEAFYYAIDLINQDPTVLNNIKLQGVAFDSCRKKERALRLSGHLLNKEARKLANTDTGSLPPIAMVGAATSDVSISLAEFLSVYKLPLISYAATNTDLQDRLKYPYFLRTVPADTSQVQVVLDILKEYKWTYVTLVFSGNRPLIILN